MNWPVHGQVCASGWLIMAADTGLFLMVSSNSSATAGADACMCVCVCVCGHVRRSTVLTSWVSFLLVTPK